MVTIYRLLTYEYPNVTTAIDDLNHRGVKLLYGIGNKRVSEMFYCPDKDSLAVLEQLSPEVEFTKPPEVMRGN